MSDFKILKNPNAPISRELIDFVDPDDGFVYDEYFDTKTKVRRKYKSISELMTHVKTRRRVKGYKEIEGLKTLIEGWLCSKPEFEARCRAPEKANRTLGQKLKLGLSVVKTLAAGAKWYVPRDHANKRASMCAKCPYNRDVEKTSLEKIENKVMSHGTSGRTTNYDHQLNECEKCGCPLKSKVHFVWNFIRENTSMGMVQNLPKNELDLNGKSFTCWMLRDVEHKEEDV